MKVMPGGMPSARRVSGSPSGSAPSIRGWIMWFPSLFPCGPGLVTVGGVGGGQGGGDPPVDVAEEAGAARTAVAHPALLAALAVVGREVEGAVDVGQPARGRAGPARADVPDLFRAGFCPVTLPQLDP